MLTFGCLCVFSNTTRYNQTGRVRLGDLLQPGQEQRGEYTSCTLVHISGAQHDGVGGFNISHIVSGSTSTHVKVERWNYDK